jgi:hypothetical protein
MSEDNWDLESHWLPRFLVRLFGRERVVRFAEWTDAELIPEGENRCPYRAPLIGEQCTYKVGHRGTCHTVTKYGDDKYWYGVNYNHDTGDYIWKKAQ